MRLTVRAESRIWQLTARQILLKSLFPIAAFFALFQIAALPFNWLLIPIGMPMGRFIVQAEPAVHALNKQEITSGAIPGGAMSASLSPGAAVFSLPVTDPAGLRLLEEDKM